MKEFWRRQLFRLIDNICSCSSPDAAQKMKFSMKDFFIFGAAWCIPLTLPHFRSSKIFRKFLITAAVAIKYFNDCSCDKLAKVILIHEETSLSSLLVFIKLLPVGYWFNININWKNRLEIYQVGFFSFWFPGNIRTILPREASIHSSFIKNRKFQ